MGTHIHSGRWTPEDRAESLYREVPFEVPPGTARVAVLLDYDRAAGVLDLGCWGADGFRGWSGGARTGFEIGPASATPGYLVGPPTAGTWRVLFGLHRVSADGLSWRLSITTSSSPADGDLNRREHAGVAIDDLVDPAAHGPSLRPQRLGTARDFPAPPGWQWLAGDLHAHTVHSDGALSVANLARLAASRGLDFQAVTDHNTVSHHPFLPDAQRAAGILLVPGQEVTTDLGHANAFGGVGWVDFRAPPQTWVAAVAEHGGLLSVNHPLADGCGWRYRLAAPLTLAEVWHTTWRDRRDGGPLAWWLAQPGAVTAVGGSDWHRPGDDAEPGSPVTWLLCQDVSVAGVLDALAAGRVSVSAEPLGPALLRLDDELAAIDAQGLLLCGEGSRREPVRAERVRVTAAPGPHWLARPDGTVMALTR